MRGTLTIARRELASFFAIPLGWVAIALYLFLTGGVFSLMILNPSTAATMRPFFSVSAWLLLPVIPAISMRLFSEEFRSGTIEPLLTSPVSDAAIAVGKYLGALGFMVLMLAPTLAHVGVLVWLSNPAPDAGPIVAGYASLVLLGMLYLSIGLFISSLTSNQTLAFLGTLFAILLLLLATTLGADRLPEVMRPLLYAAALTPRIADFAKGVIDTSHVVFFVSCSAWFVLLTIVALQSRRWS